MSDKVYLGSALSDLDIGEITTPISRVNLVVDGQTMYTAGDDTGRTIEKSVPWATQSMADDLLASLKNVEYKPFSGVDALIDPSTEIGDGITVGGTYSVLAQKDTTYGRMSTSNIAAPESDEIDDEYPYINKKQREDNRKLAQTYSYIKKTADQIKIGVANDLQEMKSEIQVSIDSIVLRIDNDLDGLHSEIEQTATSLTSTISDTKNGLESQISQTATSLESQIKNATGDVSSLKQTVNSLESSIKAADGNISTLQQTAASLQSNISSLNGSVSTINQTISNISLSVSGSLGGTASISLSAGGNTSSGSFDLSKVRSAFANDKSSITISAGTITFNSNSLIANSDNLSIDQYGNLTSKNGNFVGATVASGNDETFALLSNATMYLRRNSKKIGRIGSGYWNSATTSYNYGLSFELEDDGYYMAWCLREGSAEYYDVKLFYAGRPLQNINSSYNFLEDMLYFECQSMSRYNMFFGDNPQLPSAKIAYYVSGGIEIESYGVLDLKPSTGNNVRVFSNLNMEGYSILNESDERLKTNIKETDVSGLDVINNIKLYEFDWIKSGKHEKVGLIAQQIESEADESLTYVDKDTGIYSVKKVDIIPYLVKAVQELYNMVGGATRIRTMSVSDGWTPNYSYDDKLKFIEHSDQKEHDAHHTEEPEPIILPNTL